MVQSALEGRGVMSQMRAQMRAEVYRAIEEQSGGAGHAESEDLRSLKEHRHGMLLLHLVQQLLQHCELDASMSVLRPEAGLKLEDYPGGAALCEEAGLPAEAASGDQPLLLLLLERAMAGGGASPARPAASGASSPLASAAAAAGSPKAAPSVAVPAPATSSRSEGKRNSAPLFATERSSDGEEDDGAASHFTIRTGGAKTFLGSGDGGGGRQSSTGGGDAGGGGLSAARTPLGGLPPLGGGSSRSSSALPPLKGGLGSDADRGSGLAPKSSLFARSPALEEAAELGLDEFEDDDEFEVDDELEVMDASHSFEDVDSLPMERSVETSLGMSAIEDSMDFSVDSHAIEGYDYVESIGGGSR
eukprot:PLAT15044.1.p1 GENE.PLAT15044.1~~PLAT15044.1.p1  ORF type:complete len:370 (-),score=118.69 PLAT15044.1:126-1205(-)